MGNQSARYQTSCKAMVLNCIRNLRSSWKRGYEEEADQEQQQKRLRTTPPRGERSLYQPPSNSGNLEPALSPLLEHPPPDREARVSSHRVENHPPLLQPATRTPQRHRSPVLPDVGVFRSPSRYMVHDISTRHQAYDTRMTQATRFKSALNATLPFQEQDYSVKRDLLLVNLFAEEQPTDPAIVADFMRRLERLLATPRELFQERTQEFKQKEERLRSAPKQSSMY